MSLLQTEIIEIENDIDSIIIREKNNEIKKLEQDMTHISEIFYDLGQMIEIQGEDLKLIDKNIGNASRDVAISLRNLADAEEMTSYKYRLARNAGIIVGGVGLGALGFIAGPLIGIGTLLSGAGIGGGIIYATNR